MHEIIPKLCTLTLSIDSAWWLVAQVCTHFPSNRCLCTCPNSHMCMIYYVYSLIYLSIATIASILLVEIRLRDLEGYYGFCRTFSISNRTLNPIRLFVDYLFQNKKSHLGFFLSYFVYPFKIKQK